MAHILTKHVYPSVTENVTRFAREALPRRAERERRNLPTVTISELDCRYQTYCGPCSDFGGVICNEIGCSSKLWCINKYFDMVLDPSQKCPFRADGFPRIS